MLQKGKFGYLKKYKKRQAVKVGIGFGIILVIVATALILEHTTKTPLILAAIFGVLPTAKFLVGYLVVLPYHSYEGERLPDEIAQKGRELFDLAISSEETITYIPYLYMNRHKMYILLTQSKRQADKKKLSSYLKNWMKGESLYFAIEILEDEDSFLKKIAEDAKNQGEQKLGNDLEKAVLRILILAV